MDEQIEREKWSEVEKRLLAVADGEVIWPVYDKAGQKQDQLPPPALRMHALELLLKHHRGTRKREPRGWCLLMTFDVGANAPGRSEQWSDRFLMLLRSWIR